MKNKKFFIIAEDEKIKEYRKLPDELKLKLKWLDEVFKFMVLCETEKTKKIREKIKHGNY